MLKLPLKMAENFVNPLTTLIAGINQADKKVLWQNISNLIIQLNKLEIISVQRTCSNCKHHAIKNKNSFCNLLNQKLEAQDIRIDCGEFEMT